MSTIFRLHHKYNTLFRKLQEMYNSSLRRSVTTAAISHFDFNNNKGDSHESNDSRNDDFLLLE